MGHRANFVIVENGDWNLYYSHAGAPAVERHLFWGPAYALAWIREHRPLQKNEWLSPPWDEGGTLVDCDRKVVLFYGGDYVQFDFVLRRFYLKMMQALWPGWTLRWAYEGLGDFVDHLGLSRTLVQEKGRSDSEKLPSRDLEKLVSQLDRGTLAEVDKEDCTSHSVLLTFPDSNGWRGKLEVWMSPVSLLREGPLLWEALQRFSGQGFLRLVDWPQAGIHLDPQARKVLWWTNHGYGCQDWRRDIDEAWAGWKVLFVEDGYEAQEAHMQGGIQWPALNLSNKLDELCVCLFGKSDSLGEFFPRDAKAKGHAVSLLEETSVIPPQEWGVTEKKILLIHALETTGLKSS